MKSNLFYFVPSAKRICIEVIGLFSSKITLEGAFTCAVDGMAEAVVDDDDESSTDTLICQNVAETELS